MLVKVYKDDNIIVDYDKTNKRYRASIFEDHHFQDEFWFDAYEGNPYCSDMPDEEIDRIVDAFNSIGCTSFQVTAEELKEILERQENV